MVKEELTGKAAGRQHRQKQDQGLGLYGIKVDQTVPAPRDGRRLGSVAMSQVNGMESGDPGLDIWLPKK
jgi:hypothetical protein